MFDVVEDTLVSESKKALSVGGELKVRTVEALPGNLRDADTLRELAKASPAVYWAFLNARQQTRDNDVQLRSIWGCYIITDHAGSHAARRRGDNRQIGAYDIMHRLLPAINGYTIPDVGTAKLMRAENLFSIRIDKVGASLYAATFEIPMPLDYELELITLNGFETYHAEHSLAPGEDEPAAIDELTLEQ